MDMEQEQVAHFFTQNPNDWLEGIAPDLLEEDVWVALCKHHYNLSPLPSLSASDIFYGEYFFRKAKDAFQYQTHYDEYLQQAAQLDNYNAMEWLCLIALENDQFERALYIAQRAAEIYLTAGHMLQASIYHATSAAENLAYEQKKQAILNSLVHLQVALKLIPASQAVLQNTHWHVSEQKIAVFQAQYAEMVELTEQDKQAIMHQVKQIIANYSL